MRRYNIHILLFFIFLTGVHLFGAIQVLPGKFPLSAGLQDSLRENQVLYNGKLWRNIYYMVDGDQFLYSRKFLPGVSLKKKKSIYDVSITYRIENNLFVSLPSLMIDGVIINDPSMIVNLDPEIVEKIDVINRTYLVGKYFFSGIVNVITKSGDFSCVSLPEYLTRLAYRVIDPVRSFVSPDYSSEEFKDSRIPDYRNTLYWNPSVKTEKDGKTRVEFWSSDNKSDYIINIQGITREGKIFSLQKPIKVK